MRGVDMSEEITTEENKVSEDLESQNAEKLAKKFRLILVKKFT